MSLALITGVVPAEELTVLRMFRDRFDAITVAQFTSGAQEWARTSADATIIASADSSEFSRAWNQVTRSA